MVNAFSRSATRARTDAFPTGSKVAFRLDSMKSEDNGMKDLSSVYSNAKDNGRSSTLSVQSCAPTENSVMRAVPFPG